MPDPSPSVMLWAMYALTTGTLSVGLDSAGYEVLSGIILVLACAGWLGAVAQALLLPPRPVPVSASAPAPASAPASVSAWRRETAAALAWVAATALVGTGFSAAGLQRPAAALLALATPLWAVLLVAAGRERRGTVFLRCVATQGLAVLGATLAAAESAAWLAHAALTLFWLGLVLYCLALFRFQPRQVAEGAGDHWLPGGALAVSALAGARLLSADSDRLYLWNDDDHAVLGRVTVTLLVLTAVACVALFTAELFWPRRRYDVRRWATVFSAVGTAAAALAVAAALDAPWLDALGEALLWITVAGWLGCTAWTITSARAGGRTGRVRSGARRFRSRARR
ncbi:hypothetical protein [Streptomyces olindensis]|uniref:SLAC1 family transporter n=1 Tax=Streptomyces olindensis TaxID=358823 RepID=UPI0033D93471